MRVEGSAAGSPDRGRATWIAAASLAVPVGLATGLGLALPDGGAHAPATCAVAGLSAATATLFGVRCLFGALDRRDSRGPHGTGGVAPARSYWSTPVARPRRAALAALIVIIICWLPILLAAYPGFFDYDVGNEWHSQSLQWETGELNAHHPVLHTLFLGATMQLGRAIIGTYNGGVAVSVLIQAVLVAGLLASTLLALMRAGMSRAGSAGATVYWALDPVIGMYAFATTKDVIFSALVVALGARVLLHLRGDGAGERGACGRESGGGSHGRRATGSGAVSGPVMALAPMALLAFLVVSLRGNALPAMAVAGPIIVALARRGRRAGLAAALATGTAAALMWLGPASTAMGVEKSPIGIWDALCVPMQQLAYTAGSDEVAPADRAAVQGAVPGLEYDPQLSDAARYPFMHAPTSGSDLVALYLRLGAAYPVQYLKAYLLLTQDAWNPFAVIDAHTSASGATEVIEFEPKEPATRSSKLPALEAPLRWIASERGVERVPVLGLGVSIAAYLLALLTALARAIVRRDRAGAASLALMALLSSTNLLGPCMIIRYFLYLFLGLPLIARVALARDDGPSEEQREQEVQRGGIARPVVDGRRDEERQHQRR